jgi:hypothetical protein
MRRVALTLIGALLVLTAGTATASAAPPIDVNAQPRDGGVTVTVSVNGVPIESITTGVGAGETKENEKAQQAGLCASGIIHTSCTPADEASNK